MSRRVAIDFVVKSAKDPTQNRPLGTNEDSEDGWNSPETRSDQDKMYMGLYVKLEILSRTRADVFRLKCFSSWFTGGPDCESR